MKIHLQFRGREMAHQELGMEVVNRVKNDLLTMGHVDMEPNSSAKPSDDSFASAFEQTSAQIQQETKKLSKAESTPSDSVE